MIRSPDSLRFIPLMQAYTEGEDTDSMQTSYKCIPEISINTSLVSTIMSKAFLVSQKRCQMPPQCPKKGRKKSVALRLSLLNGLKNSIVMLQYSPIDVDTILDLVFLADICFRCSLCYQHMSSVDKST